MESGNGNKGLIIIIVILIVLVASWLALLICDYTGVFDWRSLIFKDNKIVENNNDSSIQNDVTNSTEEKNTLTRIEDFPQSDKYEVYNLQETIFDDGQSEGFLEDIIEIGGTNFNFKCGNSTNNSCEEIEMYLNNKKIFTLDVNGITEMIITDDYIILQDGLAGISVGDLVISDKTGSILKTLKNTAKGYRLTSGDEKETKMNIDNDKLYFIVADYIDGNNSNVTFKYIDLKDNLKEYDIQTFQAITQQEE